MDKWLDTFIEEKGIDLHETFELEDSFYGTAIFEYGYVVDVIKSTSTKEKKAIRDMLVRIDFANGDVRRYLRHLAHALVNK